MAEAKQAVNLMEAFIKLLNSHLPLDVNKSNSISCIRRYISVLDLNEIVKTFTKKSLELDLMWGTYTHSMLNLTQFLTVISNDASVVEQCRDQLIKVMNCQLEDYKLVFEAFIPILVQIKYSSEKFSQQLYNTAECLLDAFAKNLKHKINSGNSFKCINIYEIVARSGLIDLSTLQKYFTSQIFFLLTSDFEDKKYVLEYVVSHQNEWVYSETNDFIKCIITELLLPFNSKVVESSFKQILALSNINWKIFLIYMSHFLLLYEDGSQILKDYNLNLLRESLINSEVNKVIISLILTRQAVNEGTHIHSSYADWFKATFHENSTCANNKNSFLVLMKVLSDLAPSEPSCYLQAHILNPPHIPINCRSYFSDYVVLAKTRLQDLKVFDDKIFKYSNQSKMHSDDVQDKIMKQVNADVLSMITAFEDSRKVPAHIIELSIFRKPYYLSRFLPALLLPDSSDLRKRFIECLKEAGKIPNNLYEKYISECNKLQTKANASNTSDIPQKETSTELKNLFEELLSEILNGLTLKSTHSPGSHLQDIRKKLSLIVQKDSVNERKDLIVLNLTSREIDLQIQEVANLLILLVSKLLCSLGNLDVIHQWVDELLALVQPYKTLQHALYHRLWEIIIKMSLTLQDHQIWLASALLVHLVSLQKVLCPVSLVGEENLKPEENDIASFIIYSYVCESDEQMEFLLKFCSYYMQYAFLRYQSFSISHPTKPLQAYIPKVLIQKYSLVTQLYPDTQADNCPPIIRNIYNSKEYLGLYNSSFM